MPVYPFRCLECGEQDEVIQSIHDYDKLIPPVHCGETMDQIICPSGVVYARTPGRETGIYKLDYGTRATEDLTVPGKMERLKKEGRLRDPFDDVPANSGVNQGDIGAS